MWTRRDRAITPIHATCVSVDSLQSVSRCKLRPARSGPAEILNPAQWGPPQGKQAKILNTNINPSTGNPTSWLLACNSGPLANVQTLSNFEMFQWAFESKRDSPGLALPQLCSQAYHTLLCFEVYAVWVLVNNIGTLAHVQT